MTSPSEIPIARAEKEKVFSEVLSQGLDLRVNVTGDSMRPRIGSGDVVVVAPVDPARIAMGDILFCRGAQGECYIHRVVRIAREQGTFIVRTKGDALASLDAPVSGEEILGRIEKVEHTDGSVSDLRALSQRLRGKLKAWLGLLGSGSRGVFRALRRS